MVQHRVCSFMVLLLGVCLIAKVVAAEPIHYPRYGISFTPPPGWQGQETEFGYVLGSNTQAGMLVVTLHEIQSMAAMRAEAAQVLTDGYSYELAPVGGLEPVGDNGIGGVYQGVFGQEFAQAYAVGLVNAHGPGVLIIAVTSQMAYGPAHRQAALALAESVSFAPPEAGALDDQWTAQLSNTRLIYMSSTASRGGGDSGFASSRTEADLCGNGRFSMSHSSQVAMDVPGVSGGSHGSGGGAGQWRIEQAEGQAGVLILQFDDGRMQEYRLTPRAEHGEINVDGQRWFVSRSRAQC